MPVVREVLDCRGGIVTAPALAAELGLGRELSSVLPREVRDCAGCLPQAAAQPRQAHPTLKHEQCPNRLVETRGRHVMVKRDGHARPVDGSHRALVEQRED